MHCFCINLDNAHARWEFVKNNYAQHAPRWSLQRVVAIDTNLVVPGRVRAVEKAVFLSHCKALKESCAVKGHAWIVEDDVLLGKKSVDRIERALEAVKEREWDLLFTDVCIANLAQMLNLFENGKILLNKKKFEVINLKPVTFAGLTSYIVNEKSKKKIFDHFCSLGKIDRPIDLYIRDLVRKDKLKALCIFPFATSLSMFAENTQIQPTDTQFTDFVFNAFRRLVWDESDPRAVGDVLDKILGDDVAEEVKVLSKLVASVLSPHFKHK
jgi:GR25 family glycosyltransferase involved in LPS biosynthesis